MTHETRDTARSTETRQLRQLVHDLAESVNELAEELDKQSNGQGPPEHARKAKQMANSVKERTPKPVREEDKIDPPWIRAGYSSKQEWMEER